MKNRLGMLVSLLFLVACSAWSQFEGTIEMKMTSFDEESSPDVFTYSSTVKGSMMASEMKGTDESMGATKMILRGDKKVFWIINDREKTFLEISLKDEPKQGSRHPNEHEGQSATSKVRKTGKTETILGYSCDEWEITEGEEVTSVWGTSKLLNVLDGFSSIFGSMGEFSEGEQAGEWQQFMDMKIFPLRGTTRVDGKPTEQFEVTRVQEKKVEQSYFELPKGYKKQTFDLQKMFSPDEDDTDADDENE